MDSEPNEISRFEILRNELIELEMRVKRSTAQSIDDEVSKQLLLQDFFKCTILVSKMHSFPPSCLKYLNQNG